MADADDTSLLAGGSMRHGKHQRDCAICGVEFAQRFPKTVTCGKGCGKRLADWSRSAAYLAARARQCQHCGVTFVMASPSGKAMKGQVTEGRFCSRKCMGDAQRVYASKAEAKRAEAARRRARLGFMRRDNGPCDVCGGEIPGLRPRLTCSDECAAERNRRKAREIGLAADQRDRTPRPCKRCGTVFSPEYGDKRKVYCSPKCLKRSAKKDRSQSNHRKRARHFKVAYEPVNRLKVFERDEWKCQVCGRKTPKRLMGTFEPNAPELDHRVPMAMGGGHTWDNVQCACRSCNGAKGGTVIKGQLPLFANPGAF